MDHVLVKIKGNAKKTIYKLISDHTLYGTVTVSLQNQIEYDSDHNLDEEAWFKIDDFSSKPYCNNLLKTDFESKEYDDLEKSSFAKIAYLFCVQEGDFYFQKITPGLFVKRKTIAFGEAAEVEQGGIRLIIKQFPDAVYFKSSDKLIFKNLATISSIFKGIDQLYKEATQLEVDQFLKEPYIKLSKNFTSKKVSKPNRKRVALAMASLKKMSKEDKKEVPAYINGYCKNSLKFNEKKNRFKIKTDDDLKLLLYGIEQRFYTTPFGQEKRLANSVQKIN